MGEAVEFTYKWDNKDSVTYSQDLREFLFDYAVPAEEEIEPIGLWGKRHARHLKE